MRIANGTVYAPGGRIDIAAVASDGEVVQSANGLDVSGFRQLGGINLIRDANSDVVLIDDWEIADVDVSGRGGGGIFIRSGRFVSDGGWVFSDTHGDEDGQGINISVSENLTLGGDAWITSDTIGGGNSGSIDITTSQLQVQENGEIHVFSLYRNSGSPGDINISADNTAYSR